MDEIQEKKKARRSPAERIAEIDAKIDATQKILSDLEAQKGTAVDTIQKKINREKKKLEELTAKRDNIINPKPRKTQEEKMIEMVKAAKKAGMSLSEMKKRLFSAESSDNGN